jgi:hypothetical protein
MENLYYDFYPTELINRNELNVFMFCGFNNTPTSCFCGCGCDRLFTQEEQNKNYLKCSKFRFFQNQSHIKRFKLCVKP